MSIQSQSKLKKFGVVLLVLGAIETGICPVTAIKIAYAVDAGSVEGVSVTDAPIHLNDLQFNYITSYRGSAGKFDPYGVYSAYPDGSSVWSVMNSISASYRLSQSFEAGLSFSAMHSELTVPSGSMIATSIGHPMVDGRYHTPVFNGWAHAIAHLGLGLPWGWRDMQSSGNPSAALPPSAQDDLASGGMSGLSVRAGVGASKSLTTLPLRFAFDVSGSYSFAQTSVLSDAPDGTPPVTIQRGQTIGMSEGVAYTLSPRWTVNGGLRQSWTTDTYSAGLDVPGSAARIFSTGLGASYLANTAWRFNASFDTPFPFYSYCVNTAYSPAISIGMSYTGLPI